MSQQGAPAENFRVNTRTSEARTKSHSLGFGRAEPGASRYLSFLLAPLLFNQVAQLAFHCFERVVDDFFKRLV